MTIARPLSFLLACGAAAVLSAQPQAPPPLTLSLVDRTGTVTPPGTRWNRLDVDLERTGVVMGACSQCRCSWSHA